MRTGIWLLGARGSVAVTSMVGALAVRAGLVEPVGCVTELPPLRHPSLPAFSDLVFGGHDVSCVGLVKKAHSLIAAGVLPAAAVGAVADELSALESEVRPVPEATGPSAAEATIRQIAGELTDFRERHGLARVVVVNVASTEPPAPHHPAHADLEALSAALRTEQVLPPSSRYAFAAFLAGCSYVDFTPSTGARLPALDQLAAQQGVPYAGNDGKTGETLLKSVLAPLFALRNLKVHSWSGVNLLGGGDGATLAQPDANAAKVASKQRVLRETLGYEPQGNTRIDYVPDIGDLKTAWDLITFSGFLGTRMRLEFTWHGCDSALAAPLVLDLARLTAAAHAHGMPVRCHGSPSSSRIRSGTCATAWSSSGRTCAPGWGAGMRVHDLVQLVRGPAALSVPGDALAGASAAGTLSARTAGTAAASVCLYWAGMAANDWADRELDAVERPERPIPSGRVSAGTALAIAGGLTAAGLVIAAASGGRRTFAAASLLAGAIWAYDVRLKNTAAGPSGMALCRGLDVLMGAASGDVRRAAGPALAVATHTYAVTELSRREVTGTDRMLPVMTMGATAAVMTQAAGRSGGWLPVVLAGWYALRFGKAQRAVLHRPDAARVRAAVGAGITSLPALQGALIARSDVAGRGLLAGIVAAAAPLAARLARKVSPT